VIARSNDAKAIGIEMGVPRFQCEHLIKKYNIEVCSPNFCLYGDFSERVMDIASEFSPNSEIYSIDEIFLSYFGFNEDPVKYAKEIRLRIKRDTGLPVSIGIGPTKTLAKAANRIAKKLPAAAEGVFYLSDEATINASLEKIDVQDIWGIGPEKSQFLKRQGIDNALQLKNGA